MRSIRVEWPTFALIVAFYMVWALGTTWLSDASLLLGVVATALAVALFSSLQHEIIHGHPFAFQKANEALVFAGITVLIPFIRFRDTHLAHHWDADLTDPYDDPESNYLDPTVWARLSPLMHRVLMFNNTLLGRLLIGTCVSQISFMRADWAAIRAGDTSVRDGWLWHIPSVLIVLSWLIWVGSMPIWAYLVAAYFGLSIVKIRTFLEHQAHERASGRTAIIEDRGILAFLFLNNNLHAVHHAHPRIPWYRLPKLYFDNKERYCQRNHGYVYRSYGAVFRQYLWRRKDGVPHPLWRG